MSEIVFNHNRLAEIIKGKKVLHLNSLGKDSAVCLEWLANYAKPAQVIALNYEFLSSHPDDKKYLQYQMNRYKNIDFVSAPNPHELTNIAQGVYQDPLMQIAIINSFEYDVFKMDDYHNELLKDLGFDYISLGLSRYESVARASVFHKKGILRENKIYPIGMMSKAEIIGLIKTCDIKIHPCYKYAQSTFDNPSYYKMRSAFIANPEYKKNVYRVFPMLALDEYRYEKLLKKSKK